MNYIYLPRSVHSRPRGRIVSVNLAFVVPGEGQPDPDLGSEAPSPDSVKLQLTLNLEVYDLGGAA